MKTNLCRMTDNQARNMFFATVLLVKCNLQQKIKLKIKMAKFQLQITFIIGIIINIS